MLGFRTKKSEQKYHRNIDKECPICKRAALKSFENWKVIKNNFPYDRIAKTHDMLVPLRHVDENSLNQKELDEFKEIKNNFIKDSKYHYIIEANSKLKSIPEHFHLHLIILK